MGGSKDISFQAGNDTLVGTLVSPEYDQECLTILMIHGSGPLDRDYNHRHQKLKVFHTFAQEFERAGIASFRYDKRGCGQSGGDYYLAGFDDLTNDACAAVDMLSSRPDIGRIVLLGHSEGTMIAPVVAHRRPNVDGMILLCPTVQPIEETLLLQAERISDMVEGLSGIRGVLARLYTRFFGSIVNSQKKIIEKIKVTPNTTIRSMGTKIPVNWMRELLAHNPVEWMERVAIPVLTISGEKDIQCLPSDSNRIAALVGGDVEVHCLDNLTHILRADKEPPSFLRYNKLLENELDPRIMALCLEWIVRLDY